ncbi:phosphoesterase, MJ0936 family [Clostridium cavendishii DSM 21758]|uniref:Phosphoesterase n=1 Tax=Clostridium cavendishii DSM 21758 TaxID=1121302 RepID=A0A1M6PBF0_9CLOT|nr:metallophosphoesterase family protein [Clostridium cavendishii]SHK05275.1 phosphoesterase, MJ0936 family [Clostridium cavendishii DSM 21758]
MRIAVISDIHGNIYALMRVLENIDTENVDTIVCLGDLVGYGPHPNEVVSLIRRRNILCIKGNYDASVVDNDFTYIRETNTNSFSLPWTADELRTSNKYYLDNLPNSISLNIQNKDILFVHGSPRKINEYVTEDYVEMEQVINSANCDILVCAHTHIPYHKEINNKIIVNCGSVGKPKNGSPNATYAILEIENKRMPKVIIKSVEYEFTRTMKDMELKDFPVPLVKSYESGLE